jgi:uncharacterized protein YlxW (UPF0749 family)
MACGALAGLFAVDFANRSKIRKELQELVEDMKKLTKAVNDAHNSLAETVKKSTDRLAALEMSTMGGKR